MTLCRNTLTGIVTGEAPERHWDLGSFQVSYIPTRSRRNTNTSTFGKVTVEMSVFREERENVERKQEENEPKM